MKTNVKRKNYHLWEHRLDDLAKDSYACRVLPGILYFNMTKSMTMQGRRDLPRHQMFS